ncbi:HNH endonuclease [Marinicella litoralis]|nr:HNH endonuclease [Marinicella litoralis]
MPLEWLNCEQVAKLLALDMVQYQFGTTITRLHGGINAKSGKQSFYDIPAIIGTKGYNNHIHKQLAQYVPPLNNQTLFKRDQNLCLYCGQVFNRHELSRDHVTPVSQGGKDLWTNVVTSCKRCNNHKADRTPLQANMRLLAIPFAPNYAEYIFLQNKNIIADQMNFLMSHFPKKSPFRQLRS